MCFCTGQTSKKAEIIQLWDKTGWKKYDDPQSRNEFGYHKRLAGNLYLHVDFRVQKWNCPKLIGKGTCYNHYFWRDKGTGNIKETDWDWADFDGKRLFWAEKGKILSGEVSEQGITKLKELFDTNSLVFSELIAPY